MKKTVIVIAILVILAVGGFACFKLINKDGGINNPSGDNPDMPSNPVAETDDGPASEVVVETIPRTNTANHIEISMQYPAIRSFDNKNFENNINETIAGNLMDYINEINSVLDEKTPDTKLYRYIATYERYNSGNYLTLVINNDYQTGGIRSNTWKEIYNIDVKKETFISLGDLFESGANYETEIINEIFSQSDVDFMGGDGLKNLLAKQKFYIKNDKLVIYFDPSEVASASYGALEYEMPFEMGEDGYFIVD